MQTLSFRPPSLVVGIVETPLGWLWVMALRPVSPKPVHHVCTVLAGPSKGRRQASAGLLALQTEAGGYDAPRDGGTAEADSTQPLPPPGHLRASCPHSTQSPPIAEPLAVAQTLLYFSVSSLASVLRGGPYLTRL